MKTYQITPMQGPKDLSAILFGGGFLGSLVGLLMVGIVAALIAILTTAGLISTGGVPLIAPSLFILIAWGAGLGASSASFWVAFNNLLKKNDNPVGWIAMGVGLIGTLSTIGAILGTFLPVPGLGTLVGAAAGAVFGTLMGVGLWACVAVLTVLLTKAMASFGPKTECMAQRDSIEENAASNTLNNEIKLPVETKNETRELEKATDISVPTTTSHCTTTLTCTTQTFFQPDSKEGKSSDNSPSDSQRTSHSMS